MKKILLLLILFISCSVNAQTLYWVGGSGNFNDGNHWSLVSGGASSGIMPNANTPVVFDDNSSSSAMTVNIIGDIHLRSLIFSNSINNFNITGSNSSSLFCSGDFILNFKTFYSANTSLIFENQLANPSTIDVSKNILNSNVLFKDGNWDFKVFKTTDDKSVTIEKGNYTLTNCMLSIGNLIVNKDNVSITATKSPFKIANKLVLNDKVTINSNDFVLIANKDNPSLFNVDPSVSFGSNYRSIGPKILACAITTTFVNTTCSNSCDGVFQVIVDPSCGVGPFDIIFTTGATCIPGAVSSVTVPYTLSGLCNPNCAGFVVDVLVLDPAGGGTVVGTPFTGQTQAIVSPITITYQTAKAVDCFGQCNGTQKFFITGGQQPYNVSVDPAGLPVGQTFTNIPAVISQTATGLCAGIHTVVVLDSKLCTKTFTFNTTQPLQLFANGSSSNILCAGACTGSGTVSPSGGTSPYTVTWTSGVPTNTLITSNLCAGNVTATVVDSKTCTVTYTTNISSPPAITLTVVNTNLSCSGVCSGNATITATGGTPAFTYSLNGVATTSVIVGLCAANYTVDIKDGAGCIKSKTFTVTAPPTLTTAPTFTNVTCNATPNGTINLHPSGGTPGVAPLYTYSWVPAAPNSSINPSVGAGVYQYTVTDALNCKSVGSVTLTQPPATTLTISKTDITCFGLTNGSATVTAIGGTPGFNYTWTPVPALGQSTATISGLSAGVYSVNIKDANGCPTSTNITITQPSSVTVNITTVQPTCNGSLNGSISAAAAGGIGPYTYTLQPGAVVGGPLFSGLGAGTYSVLVGNNGCTTTKTVTLSQPAAVTLTLTATALKCFGNANSNITAGIGGGVPTYTVNWSTGATGLVLAGQGVGVVTATVTDSGGCKAIASVSVTSPTSITVSVVTTSLSCSTSTNAIATATAFGGTPNYTYSWSPTNTGTNINPNLGPGVYTVTVTDNLLCKQTQTISIIAPPALTLTATNGTVTCAGSCNGVLSVIATGGTAGYSYNWTSVPAQFTGTTTATLCQGNYFVTVTDSKGCVKTTSATVSQPLPLLAVVSGVQPSCNVCIGSATVTPNGGTPAYSYTWTNAANVVVSNSQIATNLCVGLYTVTVGDIRGCTTTATCQILQTVAIVLNTNGNLLKCFGGCTGIASANPVGGQAPYTYTWSPVAVFTQSATALCAGTYSVLVVDNKGCSNTGTVNFSNPPATTVTINHTDETCFGKCNGSATVTALGGTAPLSYQWLPGGQTTTSISGLCGGVYTVNVTDVNLCVQSQTVLINSATNITAVFTSTNPSTCILANGSISVTASGGTPGYTYTWTPGGTNANPLINISAGNYNLTVKDLAGCTQTFVATLNSLTGPTLTATSSSISCFGLCTGSATVAAVGVGALTYSWTSGAVPTNSIVAGLCSGTVGVAVTDGNSCVTNTTVNIAQPTQLIVTGITSNVTCNGASTGSINLTPSGGTPAYTYSWSPAGGIIQDPLNLPAGTYTGTTTDANSCSVINTFTITEPSTLTIAFTKKDVLCFNGCTGGAKVFIGGGTSPYTYVWTPLLPNFPGSVLDTIVNLCTGTYSVIATDNKGCTISGTVNIGQPAALTSTIISTNITCNLVCDGTGSITVAGGVGPYSYNWNTTPATLTPSVGALCAGNYQGTVTDANGCTSINTATITQPPAITIALTGTDPKCAAASNGSFTAVVNGGNPGYTFQWIPIAAPTGTMQNPTGLSLGNYTLIVTDNSGCSKQAVSSLSDPAILLANASFTSPVCSGVCSGIATSIPVGGTGAYTYSWQPSGLTSQTINNLCAGQYTVIVTDANLCTDTKTVDLIAATPITVNPVTAPATCGVSNGSIDASSVTGVGPFTYNWAAPVPGASSTNSIVVGIPAGVYTVVVTSASGCSVTAIIPLSNSNGPTGATIASTSVTCNGLCNGTATVSNAVGGTAPYVLSWLSPLSAGTSVSNLCAGTYTAQILDANNCLFFPSVLIDQPLAIADNAVIVSAACLGNCNGSIALAPNGGNGTYTYSWSPSGVTTSSVTNLCPGVITATVSDIIGCSNVFNYNLPSLTTITSSSFVTNNACFGNCNGSILVNNVAGGLPPYSMLWNDGQTNTTATLLCNGSYTVAITDANGCIGANSASVTSNPLVVVTTTITQPACNSCIGTALLSPVGGGGVFSYLWSNTQITNPATNLCAGVYVVQITDNLGCVTNTNIVINNSTGITGQTVTQVDETCALSCNGSVTVAAVGGVAPITYNWIHNNSASPSQTGLCAGTYFCNMVDANGCSLTASVVINSAATLTITSLINQSACLAPTGSITVSASGGTGPYTYAWLPAGNTATVSALPPGIYTLTVSDLNLCAKTQTYTINSINGPVITSTVTNANCSGACTGSISVFVSGGTPAYTTAWSDGSFGTSISSLCGGSYSVSVTDNVGCVAVQGYSIVGSAPIIFSVPNLNNPLCNNDCNGSITSIPSGGTLPFTYSWSPSTPTVPTSSNLCSGTQTVIITDIQGCIGIQTYTLTNPAVLGFTASVLSPTCSAATNGSIGITPFGGTPSYTYAWTIATVSSSQNILNATSGTYSLSMTDANGCKKDTSIVITSTLIVTAIAGNDTTFCQNGGITLNGSNSFGGATYDWFQLPLIPAISNTLVVTINPPIGTSSYVLVATNGSCIDRDTIQVTSNGIPTVDAGPFANIPIFTSIGIGGAPTSPTGLTYTWTPNFGTLDNFNIANPTASNTLTTQYTVTVTDANGCSNSDTVTVLITPAIKIPNGFTPNADGKNDVWQLDNLFQFPDNVVEVYNRWGELLFYSQGYAVPFDGKYKGKDLPVGTYYYIINLNDSRFPNAFTGPLTIFR